MRRRLLVLAALGAALLFALAGGAGANVLPDNPRVGDQVTTRMWCFKGTVTFTMVGPGGSIVVGSVQATPLPEGKGELTFRMPNVPVGSYVMVGSGTGCDDNRPREVRVPFTVRPGTNYPPVSNALTTDKSEVAANGNVTAVAKYFTGTVAFKVSETNQALGSAVANADGIATLSFAAPDRGGVYSVVATGQSADGVPTSVSTSFRVLDTVVAPSPAAPPAPPTSSVATAPTTVVLAAPAPAPAVPQVQVQGVSQVRGEVLARTGSNSLPMVRMGLIAATVGGALLVVGRRRHRFA